MRLGAGDVRLLTRATLWCSAGTLTPNPPTHLNPKHKPTAASPVFPYAGPALTEELRFGEGWSTKPT